MKTFKGRAALEFKLVVPDWFIQQFRDAAKAEGASEFFLRMQARHPENDDAFIEAIISNALRRIIRNGLLDELSAVGVGATVSPVKIDLVASVPDHDAEPKPQVLTVERKATLAAQILGLADALAEAPVQQVSPTMQIIEGNPTAVLQPLNHDADYGISHGGID